MKKRLQSIGAAAAMFLLIFVLLITAIELAVYGDPSYGSYRRQYEKYNVTAALDMTIGGVMTVTHYMMDYLAGKEERLSIDIRVDGKVQDFFNEQDQLHMADVRHLFEGGKMLRNIAAAVTVLLLILLLLTKMDLKDKISRAFFIAFGIWAVLAAAVGAAFAVDFSRAFTVFHEIFFTNDLWLFDPAEDYMIRMLPEGFFNAMLLRIGIIFAVLMLIAAVAFSLSAPQSGQREKRKPDGRKDKKG